MESIGDYERSIGGAQAYNHSRKSYLEFLSDPMKHFAKMAEEKNSSSKKKKKFYGGFMSKQDDDNQEGDAEEAETFAFIKVSSYEKKEIGGEQQTFAELKKGLRRIPTGMSDFLNDNEGLKEDLGLEQAKDSDNDDI